MQLHRGKRAEDVRDGATRAALCICIHTYTHIYVCIPTRPEEQLLGEPLEEPQPQGAKQGRAPYIAIIIIIESLLLLVLLLVVVIVLLVVVVGARSFFGWLL